MSKVVIDLSNYRERVSAKVAPGRYRVQVEDAEESTARTGATMITLFLKIIGGEEDGATILDRLVLTEKALFRTVNFMQAAGIPTPKKRLSIDINRFKGKVLDADIEDGDPYRGKVSSQVAGYVKVSKQDEPEEADDLDFEDDEETVNEAPQKEESREDDTKGNVITSQPSADEEEEDSEESEEIDLDEVDL